MTDRYEIQEKIGQGGIGVVYRAYDTQLKRDVAIKRMLPTDEGGDDQHAIQVMLKEATTLSALQHPNIITVYDVGIDDEGAFVVMELLKGETLDQVIQRGVLTLKDFSEVVSQTMEALIAAEAAGVLHRDLKPTNVMVNWLPSNKFQVKILDFSLAKFSTKPAPQTIDQGDSIFGSIYFMAPEQFERGNLDKRTDLYAMGCLYYFCLAGHYPFQGENAAQVMASHLQGTVIPLAQIRPDLPPLIPQWVMWLINRYADDRPEDAGEAYENYQQIASSLDMDTGKVRLPPHRRSATEEKALCNTTARRLIVPPPVETGRVGMGTSAAATSAHRLQGRHSSKRTIVLLVLLSGLAAVVGVLGYQAYQQHHAASQAVRHFEALIRRSQAPTFLGTPEEADLLADYLGGSQESAFAARRALVRLEPADDDSRAIEKALIDRIGKGSVRAQIGLLDVVKERELTEAVPALLNLAQKTSEPELQQKVFELLGRLGNESTLIPLIDRIKGNAKTDIKPHHEEAIRALCRKIGPQANQEAGAKLLALYESKTGNIRDSLLRFMAVLGYEPAIPLIAERLASLEPNQSASRIGALSAVNSWSGRHPELCEVVLQFLLEAYSTNVPHTEKVSGLLGYLHLSEEPGTSPTPREMYEDLEGFLLSPEKELFSVRIQFLRHLKGYPEDWALQIVQKFHRGNAGDSFGEPVELLAKEVSTHLERRLAQVEP